MVLQQQRPCVSGFLHLELVCMQAAVRRMIQYDDRSFPLIGMHEIPAALQTAVETCTFAQLCAFGRFPSRPGMIARAFLPPSLGLSCVFWPIGIDCLNRPRGRGPRT